MNGGRLLFGVWIAIGAAPAALADAPTAKKLEFFEKTVRPLLVNRCYDCHSGDEPESSEVPGSTRSRSARLVQERGLHRGRRAQAGRRPLSAPSSWTCVPRRGASLDSARSLRQQRCLGEGDQQERDRR